MGNTISASSPVGILSFVSIMIGFITFLSSFLTFLNVFWNALSTAANARDQVHTLLGGLGVTLREERNILRRLKKRAKQRIRTGEGGYEKTRIAREREAIEDEAVWKSLESTVKGLCREWARIEKPFRREYWGKGGRGRRRRDQSAARTRDESASGDEGDGSPPPHPYTHRRGSGRAPAGMYEMREEARRIQEARSEGRPPEYGYEYRGRSGDSDREKAPGGGWVSGSKSETMEMEINERRRYTSSMGLGLRWRWVRKKREAISLSESLSRVQTRRIARQTAGMSMCMNRMIGLMEEVEDKLEVVEHRLGRSSGVRRVPPQDDR